MSKIKKTHGQNLDKKDSLESYFDTQDAKVIYAGTSEELSSLNLEELQVIAKRFHIFPIDNKNLLIKAIKKELK